MRTLLFRYELQVTCNIIDIDRKIAIESLEINSCSETFRRNLMGRSCLNIPGEIAVLSAVKAFIMIVIGYLRFSSKISLKIFFSHPFRRIFFNVTLLCGRAIYHAWNISERLRVAWKWTGFSPGERNRKTELWKVSVSLRPLPLSALQSLASYPTIR